MNGYGDGSWDSEQGTWGGDGWEFDADGYRELTNTGAYPDYSDQVIEITLLPCSVVGCEVEESGDEIAGGLEEIDGPDMTSN